MSDFNTRKIKIRDLFASLNRERTRRSYTVTNMIYCVDVTLIGNLLSGLNKSNNFPLSLINIFLWFDFEFVRSE